MSEKNGVCGKMSRFKKKKMLCDTKSKKKNPFLFRRRAKLSVKKNVLAGEFDPTIFLKCFWKHLETLFFQEEKHVWRISFSCRKTIFLLFFLGGFSEEKIMLCDIKFEKYRLIHFTLKNTHFLTSWYVVPVGSVDDVVVPEEVFVMAGPPVWVGHHLVK